LYIYQREISILMLLLDDRRRHVPAATCYTIRRDDRSTEQLLLREFRYQSALHIK